VRGLGERYSSALLNGSPLPSPEPLQRVVPLDLFPSNVLERITVQKTYSAKYPGEFGGGVIDLQTIVTPDKPFLTLSIGTGGNSETTGRDGLTYFGSDTDFYGFDDGTRKKPAELRAGIATGRRIDGSSFSDADLRRIARSFENAPLNLLQGTQNVNPDFSIGGTAGNSMDLGWGKLGLVAVVGFENKWRTRAGVQQEGLVQGDAIEVRTDYSFVSTQNDVKTNVLLGTGVEWDDNKIGWTTIYVNDTTKEARSREGIDSLAGAFVRDDYTEWFQRDLISHQLNGAHAFGEFQDLKIDWRGAYSRARRDAPYEKGIRYRRINGRFLHDAAQEQNYTRFSEVVDSVASGGVDVSWRLPIEDRAVTLFGGLAYSDNDRTATSREFRLLALNGPLSENKRRERVDFLLSDFNIDQGFLTLRETTGSDGAAAYDATLKVAAAYVQAEIEIVPLVLATVGVRFEDATQAVHPYDIFTGNRVGGVAPLENSYVLPAATVTWNFAENQQIRLGASQTIGRPQFRELAPQQYFDTENDRLFIGNPFLIDTELFNLDARYEWFFGAGESVTVGVFYKDIDRPVESLVNETGGGIQQSYINAPRATLYGAEFDAKKYLDLPFEAEWWGEKRLYVAGNYTYAKSEVKVQDGDTVIPLGFNGVPQDARLFVRDGSQLQGQSEHIANLQLGIEDPGTRSQATLVATYVGERISARGRAGQPDIIQKPGTMLDLVIRKGEEIGNAEVTVGLEFRNLLDTEYQEFQELGGGRVDVNRYDLGRSVSLSITASF